MNEQVMENRENVARLLWTGFILLFFLIQAVIWTVALTLTANDKSHALVTGYDARGVDWEAQAAARDASRRLGWQAQWQVDSTGDIRQFHRITCTLSDSAGEPVTGAAIRIAAFHRGRAGDPQSIEFVPVADGVYSGRIRITRTGHWQFDGAARRGNDTLLISQRQFLKASG